MLFKVNQLSTHNFMPKIYDMHEMEPEKTEAPCCKKTSSHQIIYLSVNSVTLAFLSLTTIENDFR